MTTNVLQTISIIDAREVDGDPYEAAEAALREAIRAFAAADRALDVAFILARNAGMQRQIDLGDEPNAASWASSAESARIQLARREARKLSESLAPVVQAVAFNPKKAY